MSIKDELIQLILYIDDDCFLLRIMNIVKGYLEQ